MQHSNPSSAVHDQIIPANLEHNLRVSVDIRPMDGGPPISGAQVLTLSPLGIEVANHDVANMEIGTTLTLGLVINGNRAQLDGVLVSKSSSKALAGIRFSNQQYSKPATSDDRRAARRWLCPSTFLPAGVAPSPLAFNEFVYFTALDISETGLLLQTSLSNKYLLQNSILDLTLSFPLIGTAVVSAQIARVEIASSNGREYLRVGARLINISARAALLIDEYLSLFTEKGLQTGENAARNRRPPKGLRFHDIRSQADVLAVIELRKNGGSEKDELSNIDLKSRILLSTENGKPVATARVRLLSREDDYSSDPGEFEKKALPPRHQTIEISELHLGRGVTPKAIYPLFQHIVVSCVTNKRPNVVAITNNEYDDAMEYMGFTKTSNATEKPQYWCSDAIAAMTGSKVRISAWLTVWKDAAIQLTDSSVLQLSGTERILLAINILIGKLLRPFLSNS